MAFLIDPFRGAVDAALREYGAGTALLTLGVIALFLLHERLWRARLRDKNREISRIAAERDRLQDHILNKRISAAIDEEGDPKGST